MNSPAISMKFAVAASIIVLSTNALQDRRRTSPLQSSLNVTDDDPTVVPIVHHVKATVGEHGSESYNQHVSFSAAGHAAKRPSTIMGRFARLEVGGSGKRGTHKSTLLSEGVQRVLTSVAAALTYVALSCILAFLTVYWFSKDDSSFESKTEGSCGKAMSCGSSGSSSGQCQPYIEGTVNDPELPNAAKILNWAKQKSFGIKLMKELFNQADVGKRGFLTAAQCRRLCRKISISPDLLRNSIHDNLSMSDLMTAMITFLPVLEGLPVATGDFATITPEILNKFFRDVQGDRLEMKECRRLVSETSRGMDTINAYGLSQILCNFSPLYSNYWMVLDRFREVWQDMENPIQDYYISAASEPLLPHPNPAKDAIAALQRTLLMGARVINLTIIDGPDGNPTVKRAGIWSSKLPLNDVLRAIARCAFLASHYPVILLITNKCSVPQTTKMVRAIRASLGSRLVVPGNFTKVPCPELLQERFLIYETVADTPRLSESKISLRVSEEHGRQSVSANEDHQEHYYEASEVGKCPYAMNCCPASSLKEIAFLRNIDEEAEKKNAREKETDGDEKNGTPVPRMCTLDKKAFEHMTSEGKMTHTENLYMVHGIPGAHVRLSGAQMAPVKFGPRGSTDLWLNQGHFADNGGCGYILKPQWLREGKTPPSESGDLRINIISGHFLPVPRGRATGSKVRVVVSLMGAAGDEKTYETKFEEGTLNPTWGDPTSPKEEAYRFRITRPEVAALLVQLVEPSEDSKKLPKTTLSSSSQQGHIAQACAPIGCIREGYRIIPLYDARCQPVFGFLFVRVWNDFLGS